MKTKGFTLIELLAVIVILAIIALIAVPIIIDIIEDSKKEALKRSAENYLKAVELSIAKENLNGEFNPISCTIESGTTKCGDKILNVTVDGEIPDNGIIKLQDGTIVKTSSTRLIYKNGTLTYESGKLIIEEEIEPITGTPLTKLPSGKGISVDNQLVYYVPEGSDEAVVSGYRGDANYYDIMLPYSTMSQTSGEVEIAPKVKIDGKVYNVTTIADSAFVYNTDITSVIIPSTVKTIYYWAFQDCTNLSNVIISNGVTTIEGETFQGCTSLSNITIPGSVTSIGAYAFRDCTNLSNITIPSSVTRIEGGAFDNTPWLTSQKLSAQNGLVIINNNLLDGSTATGDIVIPNGVTSIGSGVFYGNTNITSVTIPSSVTNIAGAFAGCTNLSSVTIPSSVTNISSAFVGCTSLSSVTIPSSVTNIDGAFAGCTSLNNITIPSSITSVSTGTFTGTPWLSSNNNLVILNNTLFDGIDAIGDVIIPVGVTSIADYAFAGNMNITSVTIPSSVTSIGAYAFVGSDMSEININKPYGSIEGAPWGAIRMSNLQPSTINWLG